MGGERINKVVILSDRSDMRRMLAIEFSKHNYEVMEAASIDHVNEFLRHTKVKSVFLDSKMSLKSGNFVFGVKRLCPEAQVVMFDRGSTNDSRTLDFQFCKLDFIDEQLNPAAIIEKVFRQNYEILKQNLERLGFNSKQTTILEYIAQGECNKKIAEIVSLSEQGVKYHVGILLKYFNVKNRRELQLRLQEISRFHVLDNGDLKTPTQSY